VIPVATTTVTVWTLTDTEPGDAPTLTLLVQGVPAHIGQPKGSERWAPGGGTSRVDAVCWCALTPEVTATGRVVDDTTAEVWEILAVAHRRGLGLDHTRIDLRATTGRAA
jgi:hypothetical protein